MFIISYPVSTSKKTVQKYPDIAVYIAQYTEDKSDGYYWTQNKKEAITFALRNLAADFLEIAGPIWVVDMNRRGLLQIVEIEDTK